MPDPILFIGQEWDYDNTILNITKIPGSSYLSLYFNLASVHSSVTNIGLWCSITGAETKGTLCTVPTDC